MMIWPKNSSRPSILTRRSIASLIDSSRPLCTFTTYQRLLLGAAGDVPVAAPLARVLASAASVSGFDGVGSAASPSGDGSSGLWCSSVMENFLQSRVRRPGLVAGPPHHLTSVLVSPGALLGS